MASSLIWSKNRSSYSGPQAMNGPLHHIFSLTLFRTTFCPSTLLPFLLFLICTRCTPAPGSALAGPSACRAPLPTFQSLLRCCVLCEAPLTTLLKHHSTLRHALYHFPPLFFSLVIMSALKYKFSEGRSVFLCSLM